MEPVSAATIAYYTVVQDSSIGWTGGLLVLTTGGRPLEFQCSLPVRPSKAHTILFGPTLRQYLIGEVIGPLLIEKCRTPISLLCCDQPESLRLADQASFPIALIGPADQQSTANGNTVLIGDTFLQTDCDRCETAGRIAREFAAIGDTLEPLDRIREAIKEAHGHLNRSATSRDESSNAA